MTERQHLIYMNETVKPFREYLKREIYDRYQTIETLTATYLDDVPTQVRVLREEQAAKIRNEIDILRRIENVLNTLIPELKPDNGAKGDENRY